MGFNFLVLCCGGGGGVLKGLKTLFDSRKPKPKPSERETRDKEEKKKNLTWSRSENWNQTKIKTKAFFKVFEGQSQLTTHNSQLTTQSFKFLSMLCFVVVVPIVID